MSALRLDVSSELVELIAERAAELVADRQPQDPAPEPLLGVDQVAELLGTTREWVRRHQAELGAFRLSEGGGRNPIRFRASDLERFLETRRLRPPAKSCRRSWRDDPDWAVR